VDKSVISCVIDTNILIDFRSASILSKIANADLSIITTDLIAEELIEPSAREIRKIGIRIFSLNAPKIERLVELSLKYKKLSEADLSALVIAEHSNVILLTGDKELRVAAERENIVVHGTIWLINRLRQVGVVSRSEAKNILDVMWGKGRRLPRNRKL
jgi:predicted nucleic acid-binding protein